MKIREWDDFEKGTVELEVFSLLLHRDEYDFLIKKAKEFYEDHNGRYPLDVCVTMRIQILVRNWYKQETEKTTY